MAVYISVTPESRIKPSFWDGKSSVLMFLSTKSCLSLKILTATLLATVAFARPVFAQEAPTDLTVIEAPDDAVFDQTTATNSGNEDGLRSSLDGIVVDPNEQNRTAIVPRDDTIRQNNAAERAQQVGTISPNGTVTPLANTRQTAVQGGGGRSNDDPYAPLGIRMGTFTLYPVLTQSFGHTSNADFAADGSPSAFSQTDARIRGVSNWARHELSGEAGGDYEYFFNGTSDDLPNFDANALLRLDFSESWTGRIGGNVTLTTEEATSDNLTVPAPLFVDERPQLAVYGGYGEIERQAGRLNSRLRGTFTRSAYDDAVLSDGSSLSQEDRASNYLELRGRFGYEYSPLFNPFMEAAYGRRTHDITIDRNGMDRDSDTYVLRAGLEFDTGEKLNGQFAVGYQSEQFNDSQLLPLEGWIFDGIINWSPLRYTTVSATAQTQFNESTSVGESGSITHVGTLGITRDVRADLSLNARGLISLREYEGSDREDNTWQVQTGAEWRLNRTIAILGSIGYENVESTDLESSYDAVTGRIGLRLQR